MFVIYLSYLYKKFVNVTTRIFALDILYVFQIISISYVSTDVNFL